MDCITALDSVKATVDVELNRFFNEKRSEAKHIHPQTVQLVDQVCDLTLRGGKRTRAFLCWLGYVATEQSTRNSELGTLNTKLLSAMVALELFQSFALIHDDIMDEDSVRRGGPTVHEFFKSKVQSEKCKVKNAKHFGESMAILAGDLALVWADECMEEAVGSTTSGVKGVRTPEVNGNVLDFYHHMKEEIIYGQTLDVTEEHMKPGIPKELIDTYKTAWYSVIRPLQIGAAVGGAEERFVEALVPYGLAVGEGYQLRDDFLDGMIAEGAFQKQAAKYEKQATQALKAIRVSHVVTSLLTDFASFALHRPA